MENIYAIDCNLFPKSKIIEILKYNNYHFSPASPDNDKPKPEKGTGKLLYFNEDKMYFIKRAIILNNSDSGIIIGCTFRDDTNDSAFQIYFPNQVITPGFNYHPEFSKSLIRMNDFELNSSNPIITINLYKKNIDTLINENDITFENTQIRTSKRYKPVNFEETKRKGVEKLFLYKQKDFFIVIGWISQGRRNRNTVIYNKAFTEFLMGIKSIDLKIPESFDKKKNDQENNKNDNLKKENKYRQNDDYGLKYNPNPNDDNLVNPFKNNPKLKARDKNKLHQDNTPNIDKINIILEKISKLGIDSLTNNELAFLTKNSGDV